MKRYIILFMAALTAVINIKADNLVVSDQMIIRGQSKTCVISINYSNAKSYVAFQMDLTLPEGISINKEESELGNCINDEQQELTIGKIGENKYRLTSTSFNLISFDYNKREVIHLSLKATENTTGGVATLSNIQFVQNMTNSVYRIEMDDVSFNISIVDVIEFTDATVKSICVNKWDKNGDGELDTGEAASVTSYYSGVDFGNVFKGNTNIVSFNELQYFTGLGSIPANSFYGCTKLSSIVLPDNITKINNYAFQNCSLLSSIVIPNSVTSIAEGAFDYCSALATLGLSENLTTIGRNCFRGCGSLTSLVLPNSVTSVGEAAFAYCSSLISLVLSTKINMISKQTFYVCENLTSLDIPNEVTSIGTSAFEGCHSLSTLIIPNSVTSIGSGAFSGCSSLTALNIPSSVTDIGESAFSGCYNISSIVVDTGNTSYDSRNNCNAIIDTERNALIAGCKNTTVPSGVTSLGSYAFAQCEGLTSIVIPSSVTSIGQSAFEGCSDLASIDLPSNISYIGTCVFKKCTSLTDILIPSSLYSIDDYTFQDCSALTDVVIPSNIVTIGFMAFSDCTSLRSVDIPNSVTSMGGYVFQGCNSLTRIKLPHDMTSIKEYAFKGCSSLASIEIPEKVTSIEQYAFKDCSKLKTVLVNNPSPISLSTGVFPNTSTTRFYVPDGSLTLYRNAYQWSNFSNISEITKDTELGNVANTIYAQSSKVSKGGDATLEIYMKNYTYAKAYSFELKLPEGISLTKDNNNNYLYELSGRHNGHTLSVSYEKITGVYCISAQSSSSNALSDKNGLILTLKLSIDENLNGDDYDVLIQNAEFTPTYGSVVSLPYVKSMLTVESFLKGDVNGDGKVTITDAVGIVNYLLNNPAANFNELAADMNGDGSITITDAVGVVNKILQNGSSVRELMPLLNSEMIPE